jgi:hypothetical protein
MDQKVNKGTTRMGKCMCWNGLWPWKLKTLVKTEFASKVNMFEKCLEKPLSYVKGCKRQLMFCNKEFLRLKYGYLFKHSLMFWIMLSLSVWWTNHKGTCYYLMFSLLLLVWHKLWRLRFELVLMLLMLLMILMLRSSSFKRICES